MKVLLVSNYKHDQQESMLRFADMLRDGLSKSGMEVRVVQPEIRAVRLYNKKNGISKWLGYCDKFLFFPRELRKQVQWADIVHICDHSNAMYAKQLNGTPSVVTCHDMLAVRGALGEIPELKASPFGKYLQRWILSGLRRSNAVACVSHATYRDFEALAGIRKKGAQSLVVPLGLNRAYKTPDRAVAIALVRSLKAFNSDEPYIFHVGSNCKRKNRKGVLRIFARMSKDWRGRLVFAGASLDSELRELVGTLGISERVVDLGAVNDATLEALYSLAHALLFPSRYEGFGWPLIEAQACGCPVVCSNTTSLPEVVGNGALVRPVEDEMGMADDLMKLTDTDFRAQLIKNGHENLRRFDASAMIDRYIELYREVVVQHERSGVKTY